MPRRGHAETAAAPVHMRPAMAHILLAPIPLLPHPHTRPTQLITPSALPPPAPNSLQDVAIAVAVLDDAKTVKLANVLDKFTPRSALAHFSSPAVHLFH